MNRSRSSPSTDLLPGPSEVELWAVWLRAPEHVSRAYRALLSPDERARADRFTFDHLKRSYHVSQGALRLLLARYANRRPGEVSFEFGPRGKPALREGSRLRFNMGHSGGLALYAFALDGDVGVDVEEMRDISDFEGIASRYFCPSEVSDLLSIRGRVPRQKAFFRCWTRKEAYIKALGTGLSLPLDQFQVTLLPDSPAQFVHIAQDAATAAEWTLQHLDPAPNYVGALAYRGCARDAAVRQPVGAQELLDQMG